MERLGPEHIEFLRECADKPSRIHPSTLPPLDLQEMVDQGLLIKYGYGPKVKYCISKTGSKVARSFGASKELIQVAEEYVMSCGYSAEAATKIVFEHGAESILLSKKDDEREGEGQRGIKAPTDAMGKPVFKPIKN